METSLPLGSDPLPLQDAVVMRDRFSGKSRGFGFVTFYNATDAQRVAAAEHVVDGRRCDAKLALPRSSNAASAPVKVPRIFVARVPQTISDAQFKAYWEEFGPVQVREWFINRCLGSRVVGEPCGQGSAQDFSPA